MKIQLEASPSQVALVCKILESYLSDLRVEIGNTDDFDYRRKLKAEEDSIKDMLKRLEATNFMVAA